MRWFPHAQSPMGESPSVLYVLTQQDGAYLVTSIAGNGDEITASSSRFVIDLPRDVRPIHWDVSAHQRILIVEARGADRRGLPTSTQLVEIDPNYGTRHLLLSTPGISGVYASPDGRFAAVTYFEGEYGISTKRVCLLEISTTQCNLLDLRGSVGSNGVQWLGTDTVVVQIGQRIYIGHIDGTLKSWAVPSEWFVRQLAVATASSEIFAVAVTRTIPVNAIHIVTFDVDDGHMSPNFTIEFPSNDPNAIAVVINATVSSDGNRLAYTTLEGKLELRSTRSGRLLWTSPPGQSIGRIAWLTDGRRLVATVRTGEETRALKVLDVDSLSFDTLIQDFRGQLPIPQ